LSRAGAGIQVSHQFAESFAATGLKSGSTNDSLQPGDDRIAEIEEAISRDSAMMVYIGHIQGWVDREVLLGLVRNTRDREAFRFIPVLREGADIATLPPFVHQHQWVDLHDNGQVAEQIRRLLGILRKSSPSVAAVPPEYWSTHCPSWASHGARAGSRRIAFRGG